MVVGQWVRNEISMIFHTLFNDAIQSCYKMTLIVFSDKATFYSNFFKVDIFESSLKETNFLSSGIPSCFCFNGFFIVILNFKVDYSSRYGIEPSLVQLHQRK